MGVGYIGKLKLILVLGLIFLLVGCGSSSTTNGNGKASSDFKVGVVTSAAGQNDSGYNKALVEEVKALAEEHNFHAQIVEPTNGVSNALETLAVDGYDLIFSLEYDFESLINGVGGQEPLASQYPDTYFVIFNDNPNIDENGNTIHDNVISVLFNVNESSYLAGYLYTLVNENHHLLFGDNYNFVDPNETRAAGFVGGTNSNGILVFSYGFIQGINDAAEEFGVNYDYYAYYDAGFTDSAVGNTMAGTLYANGANIVFADAGTVGDGITARAKEERRLAIQVDANLDDQQPGYVLTSVLKLTDIPANTIINAFLNNEISNLENNQLYGLESGGTDITDLSVIGRYIEDEEKWNEIKSKVEEQKQKIINGEIDVINAQAGDEFVAENYQHVNIK